MTKRTYMQLWKIDNTAIVAAENERQAYDVAYGFAMSDTLYTMYQSQGRAENIGEARVGQLPAILLETD